jgi:hypothetical protein
MTLESPNGQVITGSVRLVHAAGGMRAGGEADQARQEISGADFHSRIRRGGMDQCEEHRQVTALRARRVTALSRSRRRAKTP